MGWRIIQISQPCYLRVKNKQLSYEPLEGDSLTIPLEDISVVILENNQIMLNNSLLSEMMEYDIVLFTSDFSHMPSGVMHPFHNHSRYSEMASIQIEATQPFKKRLWQSIIKSKITNQGLVLKSLSKDNSNTLLEIAKQVQSGDLKNSEAFAASIYWKSIFENFNRHDSLDIRNALLNYGYSILRGAIARSVVGAGLMPCFGIHHHNKLNSFNLVDDVMEPFRPFVDFQVNLLNLTDIKELNPIIKNKIVQILTTNCLINNDEVNILKACELISSSLAKAFKYKSIEVLKLPSFI